MKRLSPSPHRVAICLQLLTLLFRSFPLVSVLNGPLMDRLSYLVGKLTRAVRRDPDLVYNVSLLLVSPSSFVERQEIGLLLMPSTHV